MNESQFLLVLAGAGSGKTRVLVYRAAYFILNKNINPHKILLLTFTNKAANEMKERIYKLIGNDPPLASTYHSFCVKFLRIEGQIIGILPNFIIYDDSDQKSLIKEIIDDLDLPEESYQMGLIQNQLGDLKNQMLTPLQYAEIVQGDFQETLFKIYNLYEKKLKEIGALDFDDLLIKTYNILKENPEVLGKWQNKFSHILVDEWQDTNKIQYQLTKLLVGKNNSLTAVGDASQSIYSWRGADFRNINNLISNYPDIKIVNLEQNYRSTKNILLAANAVIMHNKTHPILSLWTEKSEGDKINIYGARNGMDEASFIVSEIKLLLDLGFKFNDFAILYRTNAQSRVIEEALLHSGIPYVLVGGVRFYERAEIKDILSYLRVLVNPKDSVSLKRIQKLGVKRFEKFKKLQENLEIAKYTTLGLFDLVIKETDYLSKYKRETEENFQKLENIKEFRSVAIEFPKIYEFLENVALVEAEPLFAKASKEQGKEDNVTLMTLHAAKGLEFPVVFMVGMEEGIFPHSRSLMEASEIEEERRLAYVGITRAKELLYMTYAERRLYFGQNISNPVSRFVIDIPEKLLKSNANYVRQKRWEFD
ncbi:MAG: UvrD-helicase domain-containing protein [Candidatus Woesebacteria bacterium]|nr:MAG: UvrD-helicase domain-containing protein [Candidatus Woesebacteria bacterium]